MENFYNLPPSLKVQEVAPKQATTLLPPISTSVDEQHSALNPTLPIQFHSNIFLDKDENNHPEINQGIVDIMDLIG